MRIKKINIDKHRDTIIVEKYDKGGIQAGSRLYCGCCGNMLGTVINFQPFPCSHIDLVRNMTDKTFRPGIMGGRGLLHETCRHTMFMFSHSWGFSTLEMYFGWQKKDAAANEKEKQAD